MPHPPGVAATWQSRARTISGTNFPLTIWNGMVSIRFPLRSAKPAGRAHAARDNPYMSTHPQMNRRLARIANAVR